MRDKIDMFPGSPRRPRAGERAHEAIIRLRKIGMKVEPAGRGYHVIRIPNRDQRQRLKSLVLHKNVLATRDLLKILPRIELMVSA